MSVFESSTLINKPAAVVYQFLADLNNHQQLMPDSISEWSSTTDEARFTIQNMLKLALKVEMRVENKEILIIPAEKPPFDLSLNWSLNAVDDGHTEVTIKITAELTMMLKMMASGPLQQLANHQTERLHALLN